MGAALTRRKTTYIYSFFSISPYIILFTPQILHKLSLWNAHGNKDTSQEHFTYAKFEGETENVEKQIQYIDYHFSGLLPFHI